MSRVARVGDNATMDLTNQYRQLLLEEFKKDAKVLDAERGYISVSSFNIRMKPTVLKAAGYLVAQHFAESGVTAVHGIPHSGNFLATAVAMELQAHTTEVRLHNSRKDQIIPATWKDVYRREVRSFTASQGGVDVFSGINLSFVHPKDRLLLVDDVCASGETGLKIIQGLQEKGVTVVGFAVLFDKVFQGGLERISQLGVEVFSCVRVTQVSSGDRVKLE